MNEQRMGSIFEELLKVPPEKREAALTFLVAQKTRHALKPNHATIELTPLCPFSCKMCYIKEEGLKPGATDAMLDVHIWKRIIDEIDIQELESITFTGGEIFSWREFQTLYEYAYDKGLQIGLMTNALLIDEKAVSWLSKRPPKYICVTLYGSSNESYSKLCAYDEAYDKVTKAIELMQNATLPVILQSTITKDNVDDLEEMITYSREKGIAFRYSANLFASRECTSNCVASEITQLKTSSERRERIIDKIRNGKTLEREIVTHGTLCGAGRNSYHITWRGNMQPCILLDGFQVSVLTHTVEDAWQAVRDWTKQIPQLVECQRCPAYAECGDHCLAAHYAETGEYGVPSLRRCIKRQLEENI